MDKHWLSQIELGEWFLNAQHHYKPQSDKERNLMHYCYEEGYNKGYERGIKRIDELKQLIALWENAVCEIRAENRACEGNEYIAQLCNKLENSMVAYAKGNIEDAHFTI